MDFEKFNKVLIMAKREIFGCLACEKRDFCPIGNKPVKSFLRADLLLHCEDFVELYETFKEIKEKIKEKESCGTR